MHLCIGDLTVLTLFYLYAILSIVAKIQV